MKGLGSYVISYIRSDRKEQTQENVVTVSWDESNITIDNLQPGIQYDVAVAVSTKLGKSCECACVYNICITFKPLAQFILLIPFSIVSSNVVVLHGQSSTASDNTGAIIGGVVAIALITAVTVVVFTKIIVGFMLKSRKVEVIVKQKRQANF